MPIAIDPLWLQYVAVISGKSDSTWAFRGEADGAWEFIPKVGRPSVCGSAGYRLADEKILFENFRREARRHERGLGFTAMDWMAVAQHHGLPTRLLDWSTNPLVAAWFAVADEAQVSDARIHMIRFVPSAVASLEEPFALAPAVAPALVRVPPLAARITSQQGLFSIHPNPTVAWTPWSPGSTYLYDHFDVPEASKAYFRQALHFLGFNSSRLMSDLDGLARTLQWEYRTRP